jgi:hypothetical protein
VQQARDPFELVIGLRQDVAELRAGFVHFSSDMAGVKHDIRRLDDRLFQVMLLQIGTLAAALASIAAAVISIALR